MRTAFFEGKKGGLMRVGQRWHDFFDATMPNVALRAVVMLAGIAFVAFGIALSRATDLGISAISCIPGVLNYATGFSLGTITFVFNVLLALSQIALLRRKYKPLQLLCIPFLFYFSALIDLFVLVTMQIPMPVYPVRLLFSFLSCCSIALGVWLQKKAALIMLPGDGIVQTISAVFHTDFGKTKIAFDLSLITTGAVMSFALMGGLYGVREGTIMAALIVGVIIRVIDAHLPRFDYFVPVEGHPTLTAD